MKKQIQEAKYFFFSQNFADGVRITLAILLPSLVLSYFNYFDAGLTVSLGALCVSITDSPGPLAHRRNGMLFCTIFILLTSVITAIARQNIYLLGTEILLMSFFFSMFNVYGNRAATIGTASLLIMILVMDRELTYAQIPPYCALISLGGIWYMGISLLTTTIFPYRPAQRALGDCIRETAKFLRIKSEFYNSETNLDEDYKKVVSQQVIVSEKQDAVRELLFKGRQMVKEFTNTGRVLVLTFVDMVDLYEQIMATYYDYFSLREKFANTGVLDDISELIKHVADELDNIGFAIQSNIHHVRHYQFKEPLEKLKARIDVIEKTHPEVSVLVLKKIMVNLRNVFQRVDNIQNYFNAAIIETRNPDTDRAEYARFVTHQGFDLKILKENLNPASTVFKHSVRVAAACLFGFVATKFISYGHHSYWVLLTIVIILKPAFSLTKQRNYQRIIGTVVGGLIGVLILLLVKDRTADVVLMVFFMLAAYSCQRVNYVVMVIFMTPYILILFKLLGMGPVNIIEERILDTFIGCVIAFAASYLLFPNWEAGLLQTRMKEVLVANIHYLESLHDSLSGQRKDITGYKLARKDVYVSSANLSAAFQRMTSEPKSKQRHGKEIYQFVVLNHILSSNIATIASGILSEHKKGYAPQTVRMVKNILNTLNKSVAALSDTEHKAEEVGIDNTTRHIDNSDEHLLQEQLEFIQKIGNDIHKITASIV